MRSTLLTLAALLGGCTSTGTPDHFRDCVDCPEMVTVPAGVATLGATAADPHRRPDELPERSFTIREPFAVSRHEITRHQYEAFVRATAAASEAIASPIGASAATGPTMPAPRFAIPVFLRMAITPLPA